MRENCTVRPSLTLDHLRLNFRHHLESFTVVTEGVNDSIVGNSVPFSVFEYYPRNGSKHS